MAPTPDDYLIEPGGNCPGSKDNGPCPIASNHAKGLAIALKMGEAVERGFEKIVERQEITGRKIEEIKDDFKAIDLYIRASTTWQANHVIEHEEAKEAAAEKRKFWDMVKNTSIKTAVTWGVAGLLVILGSALGIGLVALAKAKLAGP